MWFLTPAISDEEVVTVIIDPYGAIVNLPLFPLVDA
jgi:hypothetical protein